MTEYVKYIEKHKAGLEEALERDGGQFTFGDLARAIVADKAQLWVREHAALVTEIKDTPKRRTLHIWLGTGDKDAVVALHNEAITFAKENWGCTHATIMGRRGWIPTAVKEGWRVNPCVLMEREI